MKYNREDCEALALLVARLKGFEEEPKPESVILCENLKRQNLYRWGRNTFAFPELEFVNNCAYFDYQHEKIFWRTNDEVKKSQKKITMRPRKMRINKVIVSARPCKCSACASSKVVKHRRYSRIIYDLKFSISGVKRWVVDYRNHRFICQSCGKVHLIRDLNDDLFKNQFDLEYKAFVQRFGELLKPIIVTIDRFGLKRRFLSKHKKVVENFFRNCVDCEGISELTRKYQTRFVKNRNRLFTFLDHDGVPWNNNNAENAIKGFATMRRLIGGSSTEAGLRDSLMLLSVCQTLRNKGCSSLDFFHSGKTSLKQYLER